MREKFGANSAPGTAFGSSAEERCMFTGPSVVDGWMFRCYNLPSRDLLAASLRFDWPGGKASLSQAAMQKFSVSGFK